MALPLGPGTAIGYRTCGTDRSHVDSCHQPLKLTRHPYANSETMESNCFVTDCPASEFGVDRCDVVSSDVIYWKHVHWQQTTDPLPQVTNGYHCAK